MMKLARSAAALALALVAPLATAQDYNTSAPFTLRVSSDNDTLEGQYLTSCHAGAAIEALCLGGTKATATSSNTYFLNTTTSSGTDADADEGILVWVLHGSDFNVSSGLGFTPPLTSNVVAPEFEPGPSYNTVGFDEDENLYMPSANYDDADFVPGVTPQPVTPEPLYHVSTTIDWGPDVRCM